MLSRKLHIAIAHKWRIIAICTALAAIVALFTACATTNATQSHENTEIDTTDKHDNKKEHAQESAESMTAEEAAKKAAQEISAFVNMIADVDIKVVSAPKSTVKNKAFASPFIVSVVHTDGTPAPAFPLAITYPDTRDNDTIAFATVTIETGADGTASFAPPPPKCAADSIVTFAPVSPLPSADAMKACSEASVTAPYLVRTNMANDGGMIYVWDYGENGKPLVNSAKLLKEMMAFGLHNVGNAPFPTASQLSLSDEALGKAVKAYIQVGFVMYGKVNYAAPVAVSDNGKATVSLVANIKCMDIKSGKVTYATERSATVTEATKTLAIEECRKKLASIVARAVMYGM